MKAISPALTSPASIMPSMAATTRKRTEWNFALQPDGSKSRGRGTPPAVVATAAITGTVRPFPNSRCSTDFTSYLPWQAGIPRRAW